MPLSFSVCDLSDSHPVQYLIPFLPLFGLRHVFTGQAVTLQCFHDNSLVRVLLSQPGKGKVLVVDGGGSVLYALLGDQIAAAAVKNGWEGVIINGAIRDVQAINKMEIGVRAVGVCPRKTEKNNIGKQGVDLAFGSCIIKQDDWIYADEDGVIISSKPLLKEQKLKAKL